MNIINAENIPEIASVEAIICGTLTISVLITWFFENPKFHTTNAMSKTGPKTKQEITAAESQGKSDVPNVIANNNMTEPAINKNVPK